MRVAIRLALIFWTGVWLLFSLSGCVRTIDLWGARVEFVPGFDVHAGANGIDKVHDQRGVNQFSK